MMMPTKFNTAKLYIMRILSAVSKCVVVVVIIFFFIASVTQTSTFFQLRLEADYGVDDDQETAEVPGIIILTTMGSGKEGHFRSDWGSSKNETPWSEVTGYKNKTFEEMYEGPTGWAKYSWENDDDFLDARVPRHEGEFNPASFLVRRGWVQLKEPSRLKPFRTVIDNFHIGFMLNPELGAKDGTKYKELASNDRRVGFGMFMAIIPNNSFSVDSVQIRKIGSDENALPGGGFINFSKEADTSCLGGKCNFQFTADFTHKNCNPSHNSDPNLKITYSGPNYNKIHKQGWFSRSENNGDGFCYNGNVAKNVLSSRMNQDLLIKLKDSVMMPVYSISKDSLFLGQDCPGCLHKNNNGRRNLTHYKTAADINATFSHQYDNSFADRNLWQDVWYGEPYSKKTDDSNIFHNANVEKIINKGKDGNNSTTQESAKWWGFKGITELINEGKINLTPTYSALQERMNALDTLSQNSLQNSYDNLKNTYKGYPLYEPELGDPKIIENLEAIKSLTDVEIKNRPIVLALAGAYTGGDLWIHDCCSGHKGDFKDVYSVDDLEYQINVKFVQKGYQVRAVHYDVLTEVSNESLAESMLKFHLKNKGNDDSNYKINPSGPNFVETQESLNFTVQSNNRCIESVKYNAYDQDAKSPDPTGITTTTNVKALSLGESHVLNYKTDLSPGNKTFVENPKNLKFKIESFEPKFEVESKDVEMGHIYHGGHYVEAAENMKPENASKRLTQASHDGKTCGYTNKFQAINITTKEKKYLDYLEFKDKAATINVYAKNGDSWTMVNVEKGTLEFKTNIQYSIAPPSNPIVVYAKTTQRDESSKLIAHYKPFPEIIINSIDGGSITKRVSGFPRIQTDRQNISSIDKIISASPTQNLIFQGNSEPFKYTIQPVNEKCYNDKIPYLCRGNTPALSEKNPTLRFRLTSDLKRLYIASNEKNSDRMPMFVLFKGDSKEDAIKNIYVSNSKAIPAKPLEFGTDEFTQIPSKDFDFPDVTKDNDRGVYKIPETNEFSFVGDDFKLKFYPCDGNNDDLRCKIQSEEAENSKNDEFFKGFHLDILYIGKTMVIGVDFDPLKVNLYVTSSNGTIVGDDGKFPFENNKFNSSFPIKVNSIGYDVANSDKNLLGQPLSATDNQKLKYKVEVNSAERKTYYISSIIEAKRSYDSENQVFYTADDIVNRATDYQKNLEENLYLMLTSDNDTPYESKPIINDTDIYFVIKKYAKVYVDMVFSSTTSLEDPNFGLFYLDKDGLNKSKLDSFNYKYANGKSSLVTWKELAPNMISTSNSVGLRDVDNPNLIIAVKSGFDVKGIYILYDTDNTNSNEIFKGIENDDGNFCTDNDVHEFNSTSFSCKKLISTASSETVPSDTSKSLNSYALDPDKYTGINEIIKNDLKIDDVTAAKVYRLTPELINNKTYEKIFVYVVVGKSPSGMVPQL